MSEESSQNNKESPFWPVAAAIFGVGSLLGVLADNSRAQLVEADKKQAVEALTDVYAGRLLQACHWDLSDARTLNSSIPDLTPVYNAMRNECGITLPNGQQAVWTPGSMPINRDRQLVLAQ